MGFVKRGPISATSSNKWAAFVSYLTRILLRVDGCHRGRVARLDGPGEVAMLRQRERQFLPRGERKFHRHLRAGVVQAVRRQKRKA